MSTITAIRIGLEVHCEHDACTQFAHPLFNQLREGYEEVAALPLPVSVAAWRAAHRTARKRADRAERRGYAFAPVARHARAQEVTDVNLSAAVRQGRPMSSGYLQPVSSTPLPDYPCVRHGVRTYGVLLNDVLVAYAWIYRSGDLALVSQILGHADHLENEVMYLLVQGVVEAELPLGGYLVYNRYDSGTDGLRFFKTRCGFDPTPVEWSEW